MRKIFTLFAAMLLAVTVNAKVWNVPISVNDALRDSIVAATPGDTMLLSTGKYLSPEQIHLNKSITIMAANGASPVVPIRWYSDLTGENTKVNIIGVKFVGNDSIYTEKGNPVGAADHCIYPQDTLPGKELHLENCEFVGFPSHVLYNNGKNSLDSLVVNNCYFHNNDNSSIIYFDYYRKADDNQSVKAAKITNSTFANNGAKTAKYSVVYIFNKTQSAVSDVKIVLDHCTFYNNPTENTDHSSIRSYKSTNVAVSNCIFAHPSAYGRRATCLYGGTISNCLTYNLTYDSGKDGHRTEGGKPTLSNNFTADPLFVDVTKGFQVKGDWKKGEISPARGAATDGTDLGDPRWYTDPVLPDVDFEEPYVCAANKAQLVGKIAYKQPDTIYYYSDAKGTATWRFNATKACYVQVALNITKSSNDHKLKVYLIDNTTGVKIDSVAETAQNATVDDIDLGVMLIPTTGDYSVQLSNMLSWSEVHLSGITLTYYDDPMNIYLDATVWDDGGHTENYAIWDTDHSRWSKFMTPVQGQSNLWVVTVPENDKNMIFARLNGDTEKAAPSWDDKWNQTDNLSRAGYNNCFTITGWGEGTDPKSTGTWSVYGAKYYIAGSWTEWGTNKIPVCDGNSYTVKNMAAGNYKFQIVEGSTWKNMSALASIAGGGVYPAGDNDDNIEFIVAADGDITFTYISGTELTVEGITPPTVALIGEGETFHSWTKGDSIVLVPAIDQNTASVTIPNVAATNQEFKVIFEGLWLGWGTNDSKYWITSVNHSVSALGTNKNNLLLNATVAGEYTFTWTYATGTLDVTFPSPATAIDNTNVGEKAVKVLRNGQLFIEKDGKTYNVLGTVVK